jgi:hypothetical protein
MARYHDVLARVTARERGVVEWTASRQVCYTAVTVLHRYQGKWDNNSEFYYVSVSGRCLTPVVSHRNVPGCFTSHGRRLTLSLCLI